MLSLPASARVACWINAWLAARQSTDSVISGLVGQHGAVEFLPPASGPPMSAALFLGELRRRGVRRASSAFPVPGDPLGLGGPADFNVDVIDAAEGVVLHGADIGLVPLRVGTLTRWEAEPAHPPPYLPAVAESDRALRAALLEAADRLADLDVASWRPEVADALITLRRAADLDDLSPFASAQSARLAHEALRASSIVAMARADDGGAVSASQVAQRAAALQPLDRAARAGLVAATSSLDGR
ncbi:MAG: hypothetical protein QOI06_1403 [Nocardioidaceae bacterium]|jgi:hypothetical protein|nr:hypothetical protein [Nocardioidaceae bacterium]